MKFLPVVVSLAAAVRAASIGNTQFNPQAGSTFDITWFAAQGPVSIELRDGDEHNLQHVITIASGLSSQPNGDGSFSWPVPKTLPGPGPYALVITDDSGPNYSMQFSIGGVVVTAATSTDHASASASASAAFVPSSSSGTPTSTKDTSITTGTSTVSTTKSAASSTSNASQSSTPGTASSSSPTSTGPVPTATIPHNSAPSTPSSPLALVLLSVFAMFFLR